MGFGEKLVEEMEKIANALENIPEKGFMRQILHKRQNRNWKAKNRNNS